MRRKAKVNGHPVLGLRAIRGTAQLLKQKRITVPQARRLLQGVCGQAGPGPIIAAGAADQDSLRAAIAEEHYKRRLPVIARMARVIQRHLGYAESETLRKIEHAGLRSGTGAVKAANSPSGVMDLMFDYDLFESGLTLALRREEDAALQTAGEQLFEELKDQGVDNLPDAFKLAPPEAVAFLDRRENLIKEASQEIFDEIEGELQQGIEDGDSLTDLARRVKAKFADITKARATMIASTETSAAYGFSRHAGMKQAGIKRKMWWTSHLPNVRPWHREADAQVRDLDEPFNVMGENLMYPGAEGGSPENVINCHCVSTAIRPQDEAAEVERARSLAQRRRDAEEGK